MDVLEGLMEKLKILADSAKYDASCSSSGASRRNDGRIGNAHASGICHSWSADGRCISLLKILFTNKCVYDCEYCVNRRSNDFPRASFEPEELARLTVEFYRRNYIEGLFLSSAVEVSPDHTAERILESLSILRNRYGFSGYIHAKIIPGVSPELLRGIGFLADRLSVNIEMPSADSLKLFAPQKKPEAIFSPMRQIKDTLLERGKLKGPGTMFKGDDRGMQDMLTGAHGNGARLPARRGAGAPKERFAPAGQTTQMIIGAGDETDSSILSVSESLYRTFRMKRVYYSAYIPVVDSPLLPGLSEAPPLAREHRIYQADWLLRFYGFTASELFDDVHRNLDPDLDPKVMWALRNLGEFPVEINRAPYEMLLRVPGIGSVSAGRIVRHRKLAGLGFDELKRMGVVMKRARYFITCDGRYTGEKRFEADTIRNSMLQMEDGLQLSMFDSSWKRRGDGERKELLSEAGVI